MPSQRWDRAYRAKRDALKRQGMARDTPCHLCGKPIDYTLDFKHPMSFTADHLAPVATGGSMTGQLAPAHRSCNSRRGTKGLGDNPPPAPKTTRSW